MYKESIYKNYVPAITDKNKPEGSSSFFIFFEDRLLLKIKGGKPEIPFANSPEELNINIVRKQYLGTFNGYPCYSAEAESDEAAGEDMRFERLRSLFGVLDDNVFLLAGKAFQIMYWDKNHQRCGRCGAETYALENERARKCTKCGFTCYTVLAPAVITAIIKDDKILLAHNRSFKGNMYSLIAGFVEPGETLEEAVKREIMEEVGLHVKNVKYFGSQPWPFPNSLMVGFTAEYESGEIKEDGVEITAAEWFDAHSLPNIPGGISIARKIIDWYIEKFSKNN